MIPLTAHPSRSFSCLLALMLTTAACGGQDEQAGDLGRFEPGSSAGGAAAVGGDGGTSVGPAAGGPSTGTVSAASVPVCTAADYAKQPPNRGATQDAILARVVCGTTLLRYLPKSDSRRVIGMSSSVLAEGRYLSVKAPAPGDVNGFLWVDPDAGYVDSTPDAIVKRRDYEGQHPLVGRLGWVPRSCVVAVDGELPLADDSRLAPARSSWDGLATVKHVKELCVANGAYHDVDDPDQTSSYARYGTLLPGTDAVVVSYSTTAVAGGGAPFGYLFGGDQFEVLYSQSCSDDNQLRTGALPARWSYGRGTVNGVPDTLGWVWSGCLE